MQPVYANINDEIVLNEQEASAVSIYSPNVGVSERTQSEADKKEIARLRSTSTLYNEYAPLWKMFLAAYEGGAKFANGDNLFKHTREHADDFKERVKRVYYHNYCYPLVDFFTSFIFTEAIERDGGGYADYADFCTNVNKKGEDISTFMQQVSDDAQIFGMVYELVDTPTKATDDGLTLAQEKEQGIRPYWVLVRPTEVIDWVTDEFDKFTYLKRVHGVTNVQPNMSLQLVEKYTEWTTSTIKISEVDVTNPGRPQLLPSVSLPNELGIIPVNVTRYKRSKADRFMGLSFLNDIAFMSREVMNLTSLLQEFLYRQCFNILTMEEDPSVPEQEAIEGQIGTANQLKYPTGTKKPEYLTPPVAPAECLQKEREGIVQAMYKIAAQNTQSDLFNGGKASGFSKAQSFATTVPKIATRADALQQTEMNLMSLTMKCMGKEWDGAVKYKDHYEITNLTDALNQLTTLFRDLQINSKTFASTQMKRMVKEFDGKLTPEQWKKVEAEIDAIDWSEWFDTMKLAFLGRAAASPEASAVIDPTNNPSNSNVVNTLAEAEVKGKDTATAASTPTRAQSSTAEIQSESSKVSKK